MGKIISQQFRHKQTGTVVMANSLGQIKIYGGGYALDDKNISTQVLRSLADFLIETAKSIDEDDDFKLKETMSAAEKIEEI